MCAVIVNRLSLTVVWGVSFGLKVNPLPCRGFRWSPTRSLPPSGISSEIEMKRVAVIRAGVLGLTAGYHALNAGHEVVVYQADKVPGGMAAHFDFGGLSLERCYHFVCKADRPSN
jgi:putative NAD(P)-binding protein